MTTETEAPKKTTATHCPYCAFQCGMNISGSLEQAVVTGNEAFPVNKGALCVKGWTAAETLSHPERLRTPLIRTSDGQLRSASWEAAMDHIEAAIRESQSKYGPESVGMFGGGSLTNEKAYLMGKFARVALRTPNIDYNGRFCMSSAAAASIRAFGIDRGLPFPVEDIAGAKTILLVGSNAAETMPPIMQYFERQRAAGGRLIVADPRLTPTAQKADLHLQLTPGTDAALANGLLHVMIVEGLIDEDYIREHTTDFELAKASAGSYWPDRVERITGVPEMQIVCAARMLGESRSSAMILTARGAEQQAQGVNNTLSYINIALGLGLVGRPNSGYGCLTGQGNGQGGREHGQKSDQLPGYRLLADPEARRHVSDVWGVPESELPMPGPSAYELLDSLGHEGAVRSLMVFGSNVVVSAPNVLNVEAKLRSLDFLVVGDFFMSETAELADVVLPTAQWAEEEGTMTNLEGRVILRRRAFDPIPGARDEIEILSDLANRLGRGRYFDFESPEEIFDELRRASAGGPADYSGISYEKIEKSGGVFWPCPDEAHPGTPRMFVDGFPTPDGRARFHSTGYSPSAEMPDAKYPLFLTTGRVMAQYQSGTQTRRIGELRRIAPSPLAEIHPSTARSYGLAEGANITLTTRRGSADFRVRLSPGIRHDTVFVPFHWGGRKAANRLTNHALDPISRMPEFKVCAVRVDTPERNHDPT
ncbi:MAG: molybdopterin oxidoreductase family protein [Dehalococcoidia bacterium]|nr:molybdopterin oxidoreductase family protein [Dehalococcoidia bacterium]